MSSNTAKSLSAILKQSYVDKPIDAVKTDTQKIRRFRKIRQKLKKNREIK